MKFGVIFPQTEFGYDAAALKDYAQTAEALGFNHILAYDHVLGANPQRPGEGEWKGPYTFQTPFLEVFVLFSYLAGFTNKIEFTTGILILPQRQAALAAKQAATLDAITGGGRLRLGIGLGWNEVEYVALGQNFHNRGRRVEEQVELMKKLWAQPLVTFEGRWHKVPDAGLNPLPPKRKIPIWFGGHHENVLRRVARLADGWMPNYRSAAEVAPQMPMLERFLEAEGRSHKDLGIEARIHYKDRGNWEQILAEWKALGATHITINTMGIGLDSPQKHIEAIKEATKLVGRGSLY